MISRQTVDIPLRGLDTGTDPRQMVPGAMLRATNARIDKTGLWQKRYGFEALPTTGLSGTYKTVYAVEAKLFCITSTGLFRYDHPRWTALSYSLGDFDPPFKEGLLIQCHGAPVAVDAGTPNGFDLAATEAWYLSVMRISGASNRNVITLFDNSRSPWYQYEESAAGLTIKAAAAGSSLFAVTAPTTGAVLSFRQVDTANPAAPTGASTLPITDPPSATLTSVLWDVTYDWGNLSTAGDSFWTAHWRLSTTELVIIEVDDTGAKLGEWKTTLTGTPVHIRIYKHPDANKVGIAYITTTTLRALVFDTVAHTFTSDTLVATVATPTKPAVGKFDTASFLLTCGETYGSAFEAQRQACYGFTLTGTVATTPTNFGLSGRFVGTPSFASSYPVVVGLSRDVNGLFSSEQVAALDVSNAAGDIIGFGSPVCVTQQDAGAWSLEYLSKTVPTSAGTVAYLSARQIGYGEYQPIVHRVTLSDFTAPQRVVMDGPVYFAGGVLMAADLMALREANPLAPVSINNITTPNTGSLPAGDYLLVAECTYTDSFGKIHRSPLNQVTVTAASNDRITGYFQPPFSTQHSLLASPPVPTANNTSTLRLLLYLSDADEAVPRQALTATVTDASSAAGPGTQSLTTEASPTAPAVRAEATEFPPPSVHAVAVIQNRLWVVPTTRRSVLPSKLCTPYEAPRFSPLLEIPIPGSVSAVSDLDGVPVVFTEDEVYAIMGEGPANDGVTGSWGEPRRLTADCGCVDPKSVVKTPVGILFQSGEGFRLLDRSYQIARRDSGDFVGSEMRDHRDATIVQAIDIPNQNQARWVLANNTILVFDYARLVWSTYTLTGATTPVLGDSCVWNDKQVVIDSANSRILLEDIDTSVDDGNRFPVMDIETGWLHLAGLEGLQRIDRVVFSTNRLSACGLTVEMYTDEGTSADQTRTWTEAEFASLVATREQVQVSLAKGRHTRVKLRIYDSAPVTIGTGQGYTISGLTLFAGAYGRPTVVASAGRK